MEPCKGNTGAPERTDSVSTRRARIAELAQHHAGEALTNLHRFIDVIGCEHRADAEKLMRVLPKRFGRYGLTLHLDKTRLVCFEQPVTRDGKTRSGKAPETFDFLAFTHYWILSRWGAWTVSRKTAKARFTRALCKVDAWLKRNRHRRLQEQQSQLKAKFRGHDAYYGIAGNLRSLKNFHYEALKRWRYWLNRRGGKRLLSWDRFWTAINSHYRMPPARIVHADI